VTYASPRRAKGRAREEAVVAAAAQAISELGFANVRVADIAERAGIGPGHVTYYFPSKAELLLRAIRDSESDLHSQIAAQVHRISDPWKRLRRLIDLAISTGAGDPGWVLWFAVWAQAATDNAVARGGAELEGWWREELAEVIRYGYDRGDFSTEDVDGVVLSLSALIDGLSIRLTLGEAGLTRSKLLDLVMASAHLQLDPV